MDDLVHNSLVLCERCTKKRHRPSAPRRSVLDPHPAIATEAATTEVEVARVRTGVARPTSRRRLLRPLSPSTGARCHLSTTQRSTSPSTSDRSDSGIAHPYESVSATSRHAESRLTDKGGHSVSARAEHGTFTGRPAGCAVDQLTPMTSPVASVMYVPLHKTSMTSTLPKGSRTTPRRPTGMSNGSAMT